MELTFKPSEKMSSCAEAETCARAGQTFSHTHTQTHGLLIRSTNADDQASFPTLKQKKSRPKTNVKKKIQARILSLVSSLKSFFFNLK